jgi:CRISPR-associated endonuclease/helicase Cas3
MNIAHVKKNLNGIWAEPHSLEDHLSGTAKLAAKFARTFDSEIWGESLGFGHDTGKSPVKWQEYICNKSGYGYDEEAHLEGKTGKIDHSTPSAKLAEEIFGKFIGRFLGYCIAGHHAGLPDWYSDENSGRRSLSYRLAHCSTEEIRTEFKKRLETFKPSKCPWLFDINKIDLSLWIRMLFSCLVDADFLDTESYMDPEKAEKRGEYLPIEDLLTRFNKYMSDKTSKADATPVNEVRQSILSDCRKAAEQNPGIFSLTVPTGGGKTLSSLAFALEHAKKHGLVRVIYVIPYTSIIEQNAEVFREALGAEQVVEHHASLDDDDSTPRSRLAAENWDAPVIVTTSVQFFESLFAAKSSRCRKLHNIANSVVVLDEAQLVPIDYLSPIIQTMELLKLHYHVTFVISTATQPAFESRDNFKGLPIGSVVEIISDVPKLYNQLKRVTIECPRDWQRSIEWNELAKEIVVEEQVLCVVSDRKSCLELHKLLPTSTYHLSALMCGQHRSDTIAAIKTKLKNNEQVRVVSTQLVEAGVDLDFPIVYRALAGLDSIAQAAGRCNREGKLHLPGQVRVFIPPKKSPPGILRKAAETTETMLKNGLIDPLDHSNFNKFFSELYWKAGSLDTKGIVSLLTPDDYVDCGIQFQTAADNFRIIDDTMQRTILVPYGEGENLIDLLKKNGPERWILRKLQRYAVNIYTRDFSVLHIRGVLIEVCPEIFALNSSVDYSTETGLCVEETTYDPDKLIL